jgi:hypothetical protein
MSHSALHGQISASFVERNHRHDLRRTVNSVPLLRARNRRTYSPELIVSPSSVASCAQSNGVSLAASTVDGTSSAASQREELSPGQVSSPDLSLKSSSSTNSSISGCSHMATLVSGLSAPGFTPCPRLDVHSDDAG